MSQLVTDLERQLSTIARNLREPVVLADGTLVQRSTASLLYLLAEREPLRMGAVSAALNVDPSTTTRQVQYAIRLGLVAREGDPEDRRAMRLSLTLAGRETYAAMVDRQRQGLTRILDGWPDQDQDDLLRLAVVPLLPVLVPRPRAVGEHPLRARPHGAGSEWRSGRDMARGRPRCPGTGL